MSDGIPEGIAVFVKVNGFRLTIDEAVENYRYALMSHARRQAEVVVRAEEKGWKPDDSTTGGRLEFQVGARRLDPITRLGALARAEVEPTQQSEEES